MFNHYTAAVQGAHMHLYILKAVKHIIAHTFNISHWLTSTLLQWLQRGDAYHSPCLLAWLIHSDSFHRNPHRKHIMYSFFFFFFFSSLFCFSADIFVHTEIPDKSLLGIWMLSFRLRSHIQCLGLTTVFANSCDSRIALFMLKLTVAWILFYQITFMNIFLTLVIAVKSLNIFGLQEVIVVVLLVISG